jgi:hypothetical protein
MPGMGFECAVGVTKSCCFGSVSALLHGSSSAYSQVVRILSRKQTVVNLPKRALSALEGAELAKGLE